MISRILVTLFAEQFQRGKGKQIERQINDCVDYWKLDFGVCLFFLSPANIIHYVRWISLNILKRTNWSKTGLHDCLTDQVTQV